MPRKRLSEEILRPILSLLVTEALVGAARAARLTRLRLSAPAEGKRQLVVEWQTQGAIVARTRPRGRPARPRRCRQRALVLLDNAEHLLPEIARDVAVLLSKAAGPTLLVTSREWLQVAAEQEYAVAVMDDDDAVELFVARAAASGVAIGSGPQVQAVCESLDRLPLALQLAAPRLKLFSIEQLLERAPRTHA